MVKHKKLMIVLIVIGSLLLLAVGYAVLLCFCYHLGWAQAMHDKAAIVMATIKSVI